jgi:hypothetical protein
MMSTLSVAAARRWFADRNGCEIDTVQRRPSGFSWVPGPRTLRVDGKRIELDEACVSLGRNHVILSITHEAVVVEWQDEDGVQLAMTTYSVT